MKERAVHRRHRGERARLGQAAAVLAALLLGACAGPMSEGRRAMARGDYEAAARSFRRAAEERPRDASAWLALGRAEMAAERYAPAREALERAAALRPHAALPRVLIGHTWELSRRYDEALLAYRQAIELAPRSAYAHRVLGTRLLRWGRAEAAVAPLARAVELDPLARRDVERARPRALPRGGSRRRGARLPPGHGAPPGAHRPAPRPRRAARERAPLRGGPRDLRRGRPARPELRPPRTWAAASCCTSSGARTRPRPPSPARSSWPASARPTSGGCGSTGGCAAGAADTPLASSGGSLLRWRA
ncbi:MAG: tetratricopeptide repeat protein [Sandaracinaceae bacterium]|nr:tetratricopeptide repeat protein [Sandaracinaceae bacterium]